MIMNVNWQVWMVLGCQNCFVQYFLFEIVQAFSGSPLLLIYLKLRLEGLSSMGIVYLKKRFKLSFRSQVQKNKIILLSQSLKAYVIRGTLTKWLVSHSKWLKYEPRTSKAGILTFNSIQLRFSLQYICQHKQKIMSFGHIQTSKTHQTSPKYEPPEIVPAELSFGQDGQIEVQQIQKGSLQDEDKGLRVSKQSASTNACSLAKKQSVFEEENLNGLDYSFGHLHNTSPSSNKKQKFLSQCPYSVIIYGLLFNHLHLQGNSSSLPQIKKLSQNIIEIFKSSFLDLEDDICAMYPESNFSALTLMQIMHENSGTVGKRQRQLKEFMQQISPEICQLIFVNVIESQKKERKDVIEVKKGKTELSDLEKIENFSLWELQRDFKQFAELLNIRIKFYDLKVKKTYGLKSSAISVSLRKPELKSPFSLKNLNCSEEEE